MFNLNYINDHFDLKQNKEPPEPILKLNKKSEIVLYDAQCSNCMKDFKTKSKSKRNFCKEKCRVEYYLFSINKNTNIKKRVEPRQKKKTKLESGRNLILKRDSYLCYWCGKYLKSFSIDLAHLDHIYPKYLGGCDTASNIVTSCKECNLSKSNKLDIDKINKCIEDVNKRNEHFGIDSTRKVYNSNGR